MTHTPGPLIMSAKNALGSPAIYRACSDGRLMSPMAIGEAINVEDAVLWAAAPDLLTACENALHCIFGRDGWGALEAVLESAIAKAKGTENATP